MIKNKSRYILVLIILLGLFFRFKQWPDFLTFDFEKARDLIASQNIYLLQKPTLLGPVSEVDGIYHGPLYYYLVGFFYFIFRGDPRAGSVISFSFNIASIFIIFFIAKKIFNERVALISSFIYAVSFEAVSYAYWLSNPGPSVPFIFLMFFFFYRFLTQKNWKNLVFSLLSLGIAVQFQILNIIFLVSLLVMYLVSSKPKIYFKQLIISFFSFLLPISTFIIFDLKHKFLMTNVFFKTYFGGEEKSFHFSLSLFINYFQRLVDIFSDIFFPTFPFAGIIVLILVFGFILTKIFQKRENFVWKFILIWILSTLPIFLINSRMSESHAAFIGVSLGAILVISYIINAFSQKIKLFLPFILIFIVTSNLFAVDNYLTDPNKRLFDFFEGLFWKNNMNLVDYTYKETQGKDFKLDTITSPLFISPLWDYLFQWYGKKNNFNLPKRDNNVKLQYLIIEPDVGSYWKDQVIDKKEKEQTLVEEKNFGRVVLQKWTKNDIGN